MESVKISLYKMDRGYKVAFTLFALATLGGSKRFIGVFPAANRQGLLFAAATSSMGLGGARLLERRMQVKKKSPQSLLFKSAIVVATALFMTSWVAKTFGKGAKISSKANHRFALATTGTIVAARYIPVIKLGGAPSRVLNPANLRRDFTWVERHSQSDWELEESILTFSPDTILDIIGDEDVLRDDLYKSVFLFAKKNEQDTRFDACQEKVQRYKGANGTQEEAVKWYLNKIFGYLLAKQNAFARVNPHDDAGATEKQKKAFIGLIEKVSASIVDAHQNCVDQVLSQIMWLAVEIVDDFDYSEVQKLVALEVTKYRSMLIQTVVNQTGEGHAADLNVQLAKTIHEELGIPLPKSIEKGARYSGIYNAVNFKNAKANFYASYDPIRYIVEQCTYTTGNKMFIRLSQWYYNNFFDGVDGSTEQERIGLTGTDFITPELMDKRKDSAVLYWLYMQGIISSTT